MVERTAQMIELSGSPAASRTVIGWSALGAGLILLQLYIYSAWVLAGQAVPVSPGSDPVPGLVRYGILAFQAVNLTLFVGMLIWMVRSVRERGTFTIFQLLMIGWLLTYWQDPWLSALFPIFTYNANAFNLGCWCEFLPGWSTPNGSRLPEPLLVNIPAYFIMLPAAALPGLYAIRRGLKKRPDMGLVRRYLTAFGAVLIGWIPLELFATLLIHFDIWPGSIRALSLWPGQFYQVPVYEFVYFPAIVTGCSMLLHSAENGTSFVERGIERFAIGSKRRELFRVLSVVAYANVMNAIYIGLMVLMSLRADPWPEAPSWLRGELCGVGMGFCDGVTAADTVQNLDRQ